MARLNSARSPTNKRLPAAAVLLVLLIGSLQAPRASAQLSGSLLPSLQSLIAPSGLQSLFLSPPSGLLDLPTLISKAQTRNVSNPFELLFSGVGIAGLPFAPPAPAPGSAPPRDLLKTIMDTPSVPGTTQTRSNDAAAGVVSASLFLASSICLTTGAGLGTAYAAAGEALGLVNAVGSRVNLAFEYTKAGLDLRAAYATSISNLQGAFLNLADAGPTRIASALEIRAALSGNFRSQLSSLKGKVATATNALRLAQAAAQTI